MLRSLREKFRKRNQKRDDKGFTLIELLVSIAILAIVVFPTMQCFVSATKANSKARTRLQANITASSVLESAKTNTIYTYFSQCVKDYSGGGSFTLIAGKLTDSGAVQDLMSAGGSCGVIKFQTDGSGNETNKIDSVVKTATYEERADRYAFAINGIYQTNSRYDAVIIYEKTDYQDVTVDGSTYKEEDVSGFWDYYNNEYAITVLIYKHKDTPIYVTNHEDITNPTNNIAKTTGSKLDSGLKKTSTN